MQSTGRFTTKLRKIAHSHHDHCSRCGKALPREVAAYAGYTASGEEIYVGNCCKLDLAEIASHMYWWWRDYKRPIASQVLWRYMDFAKFIAMMKDRTLYFPRANLLGDFFEGARGIAERRDEWKASCLEYYRSALRNLPEGFTPMPDEKIEAEAERLFSQVEAATQNELEHTYVTCWHANTGESEAFWRLYAPPPVMGVAIRSTYSALERVMN